MTVVVLSDNMASNALPVPAPLEIHDTNAADKWRKFLAAWENYALATELDAKPQAVQVATLLTVIGEDTTRLEKNRRILSTTKNRSIRKIQIQQTYAGEWRTV